MRIFGTENTAGGIHLAKRVEGAPYPPGRAPTSCAPVGAPVPIFCYMKSFVRRKIISKPSGRDSAATRRNLGGTNLGLWRSCSAGDTSLREGEIIAIVITNAPLIEWGLISINIFTSTISSQTLVHLLYPILYPKLLVVDANWFTWWKIICSDPLCILILL